MKNSSKEWATYGNEYELIIVHTPRRLNCITIFKFYKMNLKLRYEESTNNILYYVQTEDKICSNQLKVYYIFGCSTNMLFYI